MCFQAKYQTDFWSAIAQNKKESEATEEECNTTYKKYHLHFNRGTETADIC